MEIEKYKRKGVLKNMNKLKNANFIEVSDFPECVKILRSGCANIYQDMAQKYKSEKEDFKKFCVLLNFAEALYKFVESNYYVLTGSLPERTLQTESELKEIAKRAEQKAQKEA